MPQARRLHLSFDNDKLVLKDDKQAEELPGMKWYPIETMQSLFVSPFGGLTTDQTLHMNCRRGSKIGKVWFTKASEEEDLLNDDPCVLRIDWIVDDANNVDEHEYLTGVRFTKLLEDGFEFTYEDYGFRTPGSSNW